MTDIKQLQKDRQQLFTDLYEGKIPKRIPISYNIGWETAIQFAGYDLKKAQWDSSTIYEIHDKACAEFYGDLLPVALTLRNPMPYQMLGSKGIVMSTSGQMQHPEVHSMEPEDYNDFIKDPYKMMVDKFLPKLYSELDKEPGQKALNLAKGYKSYNDELGDYIRERNKITDKYGYATIPTHGFGEAPFDFLADFLRSFTGIIRDARRMPEQVAEACEAITPHMIKLLVNSNPNPSIHKKGFIPLHMAPFLNQKQFEKLYWPSFRKVIEAMADAGQGIDLFVEQDWMRYIDYLADLPRKIS